MVQVTNDIFDATRTFADLGLRSSIVQAIEKLGWVHPTQVQAQLIPVALSGKDVIGQSKTGTGKTAAFGLPLLQLLEEKDSFGALILVPTRELAVQVSREMRELGHFSPLKDIAVYGGQRMGIQIKKLEKGPQIIVGTPGRVMDLHRRGFLPYDRIKYAILDEVDRMLDIGFREDIRRILGSMKQDHQTIFVSATISPEIERLARQYMHNPVKLELTKAQSLTVSQVKQICYAVQAWDKNRLLLELLRNEEPALTLIFCRTKQTVDALTRYLSSKGIDAHAMHGDMYQNKRNTVMRRLRDGELRVVVASDLASRGLDVDDISHVINYDLPDDPEVYIHRIGRTARAGRDGIAWSFVTPDQGQLLTAIEMLANAQIEQTEYTGFEPSPPPPHIAERLALNAKREAAARQVHSRVPVAPKARDKADESKFPGGIVPVSLPSKRMGGKVRSRRR